VSAPASASASASAHGRAARAGAVDRILCARSGQGKRHGQSGNEARTVGETVNHARKLALGSKGSITNWRVTNRQYSEHRGDSVCISNGVNAAKAYFAYSQIA
jgi:hypothetical protein